MEFTHFNPDGQAHMVDVSAKQETHRVAIAEGRIRVNHEIIMRIADRKIGKGDVLGVAQLAGVMGAKKTGELIPLCHPLLLTGVDLSLELQPEKECIAIQAIVKTDGKTGVEMEALTAVSVAALTVYDMCKAIDKNMTIEYIRLVEKTGGKSGKYRRKE